MALENKLGIIDSAALAREEEKISKKKALELFEAGYLDTLTAGTFESLSLIHKYLFGEIYEFAGKMREVNSIRKAAAQKQLLNLSIRYNLTSMLFLLKKTSS